MNTTNDSCRSWRELLSDSIISRFPRYFRKLRERAVSGEFRVSSAELADDIGIKPSQVRQDLRVLSLRSGTIGTNGYGYNPLRLFSALVVFMGVDDRYTAVIVGSGPLCDAVAGLPIFTRHGIKLEGRVADADELAEWCGARNGRFPDIAVLVTDSSPAKAAVTAAAYGVRAIVNFNETELDSAQFDGIPIMNHTLGDILMSACCRLSFE